MNGYEVVVCIYDGILLSHFKRNKIASFVETWMKVDSILQSEVSPEREKQILSINIYAIPK